MRMAYLILAHEDEDQLDALLDRLLPPGTQDFAIIHCDAHSRLWQSLRRRPADPDGRVTILPRPVAVRWGHWSMVEAMRLLIDAALEKGCDYAHLLSGADWPVVPRETIVAQIAGSPQAPCHIEARRRAFEKRMQIYRLDQRWLRIDAEKQKLAYAFTWELRRLSRWINIVRRKMGWERSRPWGVWHKGSQWWSLPSDVLAQVSTELRWLIDTGRLSGTQCADEHAIQTIVAAKYPDRLAPNRRFIVFPRRQSSPRVLTRQDLPDIAASGAWFIRKVSRARDPFYLELPGGQTEAPAPPQRIAS